MQIVEASKFETGTRHAYAMYWVYTPNGDFLVKGMFHKVEKWIEENVERGIYNYTFWDSGCRCSHWRSTRGLSIYFEKKVVKNQWRWVVSMQTKDDKWVSVAKTFRRVPHKWIPLYDESRFVLPCQKPRLIW